MMWILKVKVGRNWFKIDAYTEEFLEFTIDLYEKMDECTDILVYKMDRVVKS